MIRRIEALNFRCLRHVDVPLGRRQVLVGPNGSGKSSLIAAFTFLRDLVRKGPAAAVAGQWGTAAGHAGGGATHADALAGIACMGVARDADAFRDLVRGRPEADPRFELAVELELPEEVRDQLPAEKGYCTYRYEVALAADEEGVGIRAERGILMPRRQAADGDQAYLFPDLPEPPATILAPPRAGARTVVSKSARGMDRFYVEQDRRGWITDIALGPERSALGNLPASPGTLPASTFARGVLAGAVTRLRPRVMAMRRPCSPEFPDQVLAADGANLAPVVHRLRGDHREAFDEWLALLCGALPGLTDIGVERRKADRHRYLTLTLASGMVTPSWMLSGGILRLLALTLPAFLPGSGGIFLVEEPERGIHPGALGALHASLFSMPGAQVVATTYSPALQRLFDSRDVLLCERDEDGAATIARRRRTERGETEDSGS